MVAANATCLASIYPALLAALMEANYTIIPSDDGSPQVIKLDESPLSTKELSVLATNVDNVKFTLFTRNNRPFGQVLYLNDINSVARSDWDEKRPTVFVTHGWNSDGTKPVCTMIRDAFLRVEDTNVIIIDWSSVAKNVVYSTVVKGIPAVAEHVGTFVNFLRVKANLNTARLQMVGHSLGAHVASLGARAASKYCEVAQVVALDPAKPMFQYKGPGQRVDRTDARNVQVIHTSNILGINYVMGTSDFYANGGKSQPGCTNDMFGSCAHFRSYEYYRESIVNPRGFPGTPDKSGPIAYMGGAIIDPRAKGIYRFKTASQSPYALDG